MGVAISIFLGFRNNTAYQRFWEARGLWGRLINVSRSLARQVLTLVAPLPKTGSQDGDSDQRERIRTFQRETILMIAAYAHALRHHLRDTDGQAELAHLLPSGDAEALRGQSNVPLALVQRLGEKLEGARQQGWIRDTDMITFQTGLTEMDAAQGGCERIKNTPVPVTYAILSHNIVAFFCYFLPFGILDSVKLLTPLVVFLVSYAFFGLDALGEEVTDPFGTDPHDVPLEQLSETIEKNMRQLLNAPPHSTLETASAQKPISGVNLSILSLCSGAFGLTCRGRLFFWLQGEKVSC